MWLFVLFVVIVISLEFPYIWLIVPVCLLLYWMFDPSDLDEEERKRKRQKRLDECRKRRYGNNRRF